MPTLELKSICKSYDGFVAVDQLSFAIEPGSVFGLLGPNGAGKTTSIRMMIGIMMPDTGAVWMFGEPFRRPMLDRVGYLPEERGLYRKMKVMELLVFLAGLKGVARSEAERRAKDWLERLDLAEWAAKKIEDLSKGMQQKLQFIAAVLHNPEFLILDEPFSGLDPSSALVLKDALLDLKKQGKTVLFSTHRMDTVERLCDSICLINHGRSVLAGELKAIKAELRHQQPATGVRGRAALPERRLGGAELQRLRQLRGAEAGGGDRRAEGTEAGDAERAHPALPVGGALTGTDFYRRGGAEEGQRRGGESCVTCC